MASHLQAVPIVWGLGILAVCMIPGMLAGMVNGIVNLRANLFHDMARTETELSSAARNWMMGIGVTVIALGLFASL